MDVSDHLCVVCVLVVVSLRVVRALLPVVRAGVVAGSRVVVRVLPPGLLLLVVLYVGGVVVVVLGVVGLVVSVTSASS